jgi:hypothetical protein
VKRAIVSKSMKKPKKRRIFPVMKSKARSETEDIDSDSGRARILEDTSFKPYLGQNPNHPLPWRRPSKRFSHSDGLAYMKQLNPQPNSPNWKDLILEWISKVFGAHIDIYFRASS